MVPDTFLEYYYGKYKVVDLHTLTKEDAKIELINAINSADIDIKCLVIVHGYHGGTVIKKLVRKEFVYFVSRYSQKSDVERRHDEAKMSFFVVRKYNATNYNTISS